MEKETFILRTEWYESIQELDEKCKAELLDNLFLFHLNEETKINLNNLSVKLVWKLIEPNLRRNINYYDRRKLTSSENGKKGGRPPKKQQVTKPIKNLKNLTEPIESLSDTDSDTDSVINVLLEKEPKESDFEISEIEKLKKENEILLKKIEEEKRKKVAPKKEKSFTPPNLEEVVLFFQENGFEESYAAHVFNYYNDAQWKDGTGKQVLSWKSKMRANWFKDEKKINQNGGKEQSGGNQKQPYFFDRERATKAILSQNSGGISQD